MTRRGWVRQINGRESDHALRLHRHPRRRSSPGGRADLSARRHDLRQRGEQDGQRVAGGPGRPARLQAAREDEPDPHDPGPPTSLRAALLRSVRRHRGAARRRTAPCRREARRPGVHREVRLAGEATAAAVCAGHHRLVAGEPALLRRLAAGADLGLLAASAAHLPPPDAGADLAAAGRARAGPGDLRAFRRREVGRGRPDVLAGGGEKGRVGKLDSLRTIHESTTMPPREPYCGTVGCPALGTGPH